MIWAFSSPYFFFFFGYDVVVYSVDQLDGEILRPCPAHNIVLRNLSANMEHRFCISVSTRNGDQNSSTYSWFIGKLFKQIHQKSITTRS